MSELRIGSGFDVHKFAAGRKLILGGVEIPFEKGLGGHSDADVLTHSVCDAILGAAGLRDIGFHFPDSDPLYKDISSLELLEKTIALAEERSLQPVNVDITLIAEEPKIGKYVEAMVDNLKDTLGSQCQINTKATTTEGLGFIGRSEGIASMAVCLMKNARQ